MVYFCCSISIVGITASSSDYTVADDIELTFTPSGPSTQSFSFTPINDGRVENDETVMATLSTTDLQAEILRNQVEITIQDDDSTFYYIFGIAPGVRKNNIRMFGLIPLLCYF